MYLFFSPASLRLSNQSAVVIVLLSDTQIQKQFATEGISIFLRDSLGHTLTLNEAMEEDSFALLEEMKEGEIALRNKNYHIYARYQPSYSLFAVMKSDSYMGELRKSRLLLFLYVLFCMIVGGITSYFLAKRQYSPIEELLSLTNRASGEHSLIRGTEYDLIKNSIRTILSKYEENEDKMKDQDIQLQSNCLAALLRSRHTSASTDLGYYRQLQAAFPREDYILFSFDIADLREPVEEDSEKSEPAEKRGNVLYLLLRNVMLEFLSGRYTLVSTRLEDYFYFLATEKTPASGTEFSDLEQTLNQVVQFLQETYHMTVWGNISNRHSGLSGILEAYRELNMLTDYRNRIGSDQIVLLYSQAAAQTEILVQLQFWEKEQLAVRYIENHQYHLVYPLLTQLSQSDELIPENESQIVIEVSKINSHKRQETLSPLEQKMQEVAVYIDLHYTDKQLSVSEISEVFELSVSYLSRKFKEKQGIGILTYINQKRLQKAKELLGEGISISETASEVGFYTTRPLLRLFRDKEGVTPVEYQKRILQEKELQE